MRRLYPSDDFRDDVAGPDDFDRVTHANAFARELAPVV
jgi:hypothetical protein